MASEKANQAEEAPATGEDFNEDEPRISEEESAMLGVVHDAQRQHNWPTVSQLRVAFYKLNRDLEELKSPVRPPSATLGAGELPSTLEHAGGSDPISYRLDRAHRAVGSGPLAFYHRGVAVRMLRDYLRDLLALNARQIEDLAEVMRQPRVQSVQKRVDEYRRALREMEEANAREPDGLLTWEERNILKLMLEDYTRGLEELLEDPDDFEAINHLEDVLIKVRTQIDEVDLGIPLDFSETRFDDMTESLALSLQGAEALFKEFSALHSQGVEVFKLQCGFVAETLSRIAGERFRRYNETLRLVQSLEVEDRTVSARQRIFKGVAFCIESLSELARMFQSVVDLLTMCSRKEWWITALELSNALTQATIPRWSAFSLAIRGCEWSMDIVDLAFHALSQLLDGVSTLLDVVFKWSDQNGRMVLEIHGNCSQDQEGRIVDNSPGLLEVTRELEAKDVAVLVQKLVELKKTPRKLFFPSNANMHAIADFLSHKLNGPIPEPNSLPYTFRVNTSTLTYLHFIDSGASGMVAEYKWLGHKVAVKTIKSPGLGRKRFEEEAAILATVQHPNVVQMIGCAYDEKVEAGLLIMELMQHDLRSVIEKRCPTPGPGVSPFPLIVAIDLMLQIAEGMQYLRDHSILHRDMKAKNVLINRCRRVRRSLSGAYRRFPDLATLLHTEEYYLAKLADFGIAKARPLSSRQLTMMAGTTPWRAPEVFNIPDMEIANHYKWPADVYSFALTCYEILTGRIPFDGVPNGKIYQSIVAGDRPSLDEVTMAQPLRDLIERCWATEPTERPTFAEICRTLWQCKVENILRVFRLHISPSRAHSL